MVTFLPVAIARERSLDHSNRALHRTLFGILRAPSGGVASPARSRRMLIVAAYFAAAFVTTLSALMLLAV